MLQVFARAEHVYPSEMITGFEHVSFCRPACGFQNHAQGLQFPVPCKADPTEARSSCGSWTSFKVSQVGAGGTKSSKKFTIGDDEGGGTGGNEVAGSSAVIKEGPEPI